MSVTIYKTVERISFALTKEGKPHLTDRGHYQAYIHFGEPALTITTWLTPEFAKLMPSFSEINHTLKQDE